MKKRRTRTVLTMLALGSFVSALSLSPAMAAVTPSPSPATITATNNLTGTPDTIVVSSLIPGNVVRVYASTTATSPLGTAIVPGAGTSATVTVPQLGLAAGSVYVTLTTSGNTESARATAPYLAEPVSTALDPSTITVTNSPEGTPDSVDVASGLVSGDIVKVYATSTASTPVGMTTSTGTSASVSVQQLGKTSGSVFVSVTNSGKLESPRVSQTFAAEPISTAPAASSIAVTNNIEGVDDTVTVSSIATGDIVKVYASSGSTTPLGGTVSTGTSATVNIYQLGKAGGSVFVTVTQSGKNPSPKVSQTFAAESISTAPVTGNITVTNNAEGTADTVAFASLAAGDVVTIYPTATGGDPWGSATEATGAATVTVNQLGAAGTTVHATIRSTGKLESARTAVTVAPETTTGALTLADITVTNNAEGMADTVDISNVVATDIIKVYASNTATIPIGMVTSSGTTATVIIPQLGKSAGNVYVSVTASGKRESSRTQQSYIAEDVSVAPDVTANTIVATNNLEGVPDTIALANLTAGDIVKVYASNSAKAVPIGIAKATGTTVTVAIPQLGKAAGTAYVSLTSSNALESAKTPVPYSAEATTTAPVLADIAVNNNIDGTADTVVVNNVVSGDIIKVYASSAAKDPIGVVTASSTTATVTIPQLGKGAGNVYVSKTAASSLESDRTSQSFTAEGVATAPDGTAITVAVTNSLEGTPDAIDLTGVVAGDIVRVYATSAAKAPIGIAKATGTTVSVLVPQLGRTAGSLYVSIAKATALESTKYATAYSAEPTTTAPIVTDVTPVNNAAGTADTVAVANVVSGDIVKVYANATTTTPIGAVTAGGTTAIITIPQIGKSAGNLYVTNSNAGKWESDRTVVPFTAEAVSTPPDGTTITVVATNNAEGTADTVDLTGVVAGDIVKVYASATAATIPGGIAKATGTTASVVVPQLGRTAGSVYVTITSAGKLESPKYAAAYLAESTSTAPVMADITVVNKPDGTADTVAVINIVSGDIVRVYSTATGGSPIGEISSSGTSATVVIPQLGKVTGSVYVSVTNTGKLESDRTAQTYLAEQNSTAPTPANITVTNNVAGTADTVDVAGLTVGDTVRVYTTSTATTPKATAVVSSGTSISISIYQLGQKAGTVYVSVTSPNSRESGKTPKTYGAELQTAQLAPGAITVTNNSEGSDDTVVVTGLTSGDVVKVYANASATTPLGAATADGTGTATVNIYQLGKAAGTVFVTVTTASKLESTKTSKTYVME